MSRYDDLGPEFDESGFDADLAPAALECADVRALLPRHLDGEVEEPHAGHLRGHLLACPACRARFQDERSLKRWFVPFEPPAVPAGFAARVAVLAASGAAPRGAPARAFDDVRATVSAPTELPSLERFTTRWVAAAAAVLLGLSLALALDARPERPRVLLADPLPEALERLEELNRAERGETDAAARPVAGARP